MHIVLGRLAFKFSLSEKNVCRLHHVKYVDEGLLIQNLGPFSRHHVLCYANDFRYCIGAFSHNSGFRNEMVINVSASLQKTEYYIFLWESMCVR